MTFSADVKPLPPFGIVVAMASNRVIGIENRLPWRLPNDLKYFKRRTLGHPVMMGRLTFESIGRPLPGRHNIVITRQKSWSHDGVSVAHSLEEALLVAQSGPYGDQQPLLIGGAQLYEQALPDCHTLYLTEVQAEVPGDAFFPELESTAWRECEREVHPQDEANEYPHAFVVLARV